MDSWIEPFLQQQRVGRLATVSADGRPHVVPIVYAFDGERLFTPIDAKPKQVAPQQLQRVRNIRANSHVAVVVDHYSDDWAQLAWVMLRGAAELVTSGPHWERGARLLKARYSQYTTMPLAGSPILVVHVEKVSAWRAAAGG